MGSFDQRFDDAPGSAGNGPQDGTYLSTASSRKLSMASTFF
jgi:hypothetical protein